MRDQDIKNARAQNTLHSRAFPLSYGGPSLVLTALLSSVALGLCAQFLRYGQLATKSSCAVATDGLAVFEPCDHFVESDLRHAIGAPWRLHVPQQEHADLVRIVQ